MSVNIKFSIDMSPVANYVLQMNKRPLISRLQIHNAGQTLRDVKLRITSPIKDLLLPFEVHLDVVPAGQTMEITKAKELLLNGQTLADMKSKLVAEMVISITKDGQELYAEAKQFAVTPFNYWKSIESHKELVASFVLPAHPLVDQLAHRSSEIAAKWGSSGSRTGYLSNNPKLVYTYIAAVYEAIKERKIGYAIAPPSHTDYDGQRIRLPHELMAEDAEAGNCIEMSCLFAAVLENLGLNPFLVLVPGHCFAGCWLERKNFNTPVVTAVTELLKRVPTDMGNGRPGNGELVVVECTMMNHGNEYGFEAAMHTAIKELQRSFDYAVDVVAARHAGVTPLPLREDKETGGYSVQVLVFPDTHKAKPEELDNVTPDEGQPAVYTKTEEWERRTLGIDLRNSLVNAGFSKKSTIPLYCSNMTALTDALNSGAVFELLTMQDDDPPKTFEDLNSFDERQTHDLEQNRFRAPISAEEISKRTKALSKASKTALEERGSNTLYLTAGMVRWFESPSAKEKARYAPLLLYPVELIASGNGYKLKLRDEEVLLNATFMELMKQKFKIMLPQWENLPTKETGGVDIPKIIASIRHAIVEQPRWEVMKAVTVSNFDFADFALWRDIHENKDVLENNKLVKSMMEGRVAFETDDAYFLRGTPEDTVVLPVRADASQQFAVEAALKGHTFAMNGPAGTGKSECITGTIAVKMGAGEKVALTAEKKAAVDVPRSRLEALGLGDFILELHSANNSNKGRVLQQLEHILEMAEQLPEENTLFEGGISKLSTVKEDLDSYARALHTVSQCGMSLYELTTAYEEVDKVDIDGFWLDPDTLPAPETIDAQSINRQQELLQRMATMVKAVGNPAKHALRQVTGTEYSQAFKQKMHAAVTGYQQALEKVEQAAEAFAEACQLPAADTYTEICSFAELAKQMEQWNSFPGSWGGDGDLSGTTQPLQELAAQHTKAAALRSVLLDTWDARFLEEDSHQLINAYNTAANSPIIMSRFLLGKLSRRLLPLQKQTVMPEDLGEHLVRLRHYQTCRETTKRMEQEQNAVLQDSFGQPPYDWEKINDTIKKAELSDARIRALTKQGDGNFRAMNAGNQQCIEASADMAHAWETVSTKREYLYQTLGIRPLTGGSDWIAAERKRCQAMSQQIDLLKDWTAFNRLCKQVSDGGMECVVEAYRAGIEPERVNATYMKTLYQRLIADLIDRNPTLSQFNGTVFNDRIESLRRLDKGVTELSRKEIHNKVLANIRQVVATAKKEDSQLSSLKKVIRSKGRGMTLRQIFRQHLPLIRELCPCMMFSPASMAQYLPMENGLFDLVIFDEASQIPTARAVGALARGDNAMIVGDVNQMPPTTFFTSNMVDEDNLETEDLESVLDDCLALNIPSTHLKWHYRSRHESLIEFSNKRFYDNKLLTFPSATDRNSHVHLHMISDGVYEGGTTRRNPKEAEAVIDYLRRHCAGPDSHMSVGVITFNAEQQRLVEQLLQEACRTDERLAAWCDRSTEPMFIKNLENVQGDERDVILMSVNYGPDKEGKVSLNFGPLNKEGGWRRLNVAVSRARQKMEVFTSMRPEQIDLSRSNARGVHELRAFIEFAGGRQLPVDRSTLRLLDAPAGVAENLCFRLEHAGYETVRNVGCSDLRVDVAVVHPLHPDQYIMGILLDGGSYAAAKTTRDRELSQIDVLQGLGWNIRRVWTLDWYDNREKELGALLRELEELSGNRAAG